MGDCRFGVSPVNYPDPDLVCVISQRYSIFTPPTLLSDSAQNESNYLDLLTIVLLVTLKTDITEVSV